MSGSGKNNGMRGIELTLPASSANLGPAFDSAAMALDLYLRVRAEAASAFAVAASGRDADICGTVERNLILDTYREVLKNASTKCVPLALAVENEIPIGKGCGSSAAARLAGVALAVHFGSLGWTDEQIIEEAVRLEGHADGVPPPVHRRRGDAAHADEPPVPPLQPADLRLAARGQRAAASKITVAIPSCQCASINQSGAPRICPGCQRVR